MPGKALFFGTNDQYTGWTPSNADVDATTSTTIQYDVNGAYAYSNLNHPEWTQSSDAGVFIYAFGKITGSGTGFAYATSFPSPKYEIYLFYVNIDTNALDFQSNFSVGVVEAAVNAIFGPDCIGVQVNFITGYGGAATVVPTYKSVTNLVANGNPRPSIQRPKTIAAKDHRQQDWTMVPCIGGSVPSQTFYSPCGETVWGPLINSWRWCCAGLPEPLVLYSLRADNGFPYTIRAYFLNAVGKKINTTGTVITLTSYSHAFFVFGRGQTPGWASGNLTPPTGAVGYYLTYEDPATPGVEVTFPGYLMASNLPMPSHYASDYGAYVPGNCMATTITEADMP